MAGTGIPGRVTIAAHFSAMIIDHMADLRSPKGQDHLHQSEVTA
jgi:hypothetical protein